MSSSLAITIETLVLVAAWNNPAVFQGVFKITRQEGDEKGLFFFRCESFCTKPDLLEDDFSHACYEFTHLYHDPDAVSLDRLDEVEDYALYMLKYALHRTLQEMLRDRKQQIMSIDDAAVQALISKIQPMLNRVLPLPGPDDHTGFAVAMDFHPKEALAELAVKALLANLERPGAATGLH